MDNKTPDNCGQSRLQPYLSPLSVWALAALVLTSLIGMLRALGRGFQSIKTREQQNLPFGELSLDPLSRNTLTFCNQFV